MATQPVPCRLDPELIALVDGEAAIAGRKRATQIAAIVDAHFRGNGHAQSSGSDKQIEQYSHILETVRLVLAESTTHTKILAQKESEVTSDLERLGRQIDELRTDIATLFAAALEAFAGIERDEACAFTQTHMYPAGRR